MAKKKKEESKKERKERKETEREQRGLFAGVKEETIHSVFSIICFVLGLFFSLAAFHDALGVDKAGPVGGALFSFFKYLFGVGYFLLPLFFFMLAVAYILNIKQRFTWSKILSSLLSLLTALGIIDLVTSSRGQMIGQGGVVGHLISKPMLSLFAFTASMIILIGILLVSLLLTFDTRLDTHIISLWKKMFSKKTADENALAGQNKDVEDEVSKALEANGELVIDEKEKEALENERRLREQARANDEKNKAPKQKPITVIKGDELADDIILQPQLPPRRIQNYTPIPLSLLEVDSGKPGVGDIKANANIIKRTLQNFGIDVEMDEISIGPSVTRYALKPAEGVKLARIVGLQNDLALALAAHPIRIEAPIPGKSLVGIEIPNNIKTKVGLGTLLASSDYQQSDKPLLVALGKAINGKAIFSNMAKMPHLLIAGATGSGKSVTIHAIIMSLLYRNGPQTLKFIMIDPKRVELTLYNKIPHLLTPVITEAKKAILSLKWAAKEMDRRYDILEANSVRDIESYHKNVLDPAIKKQQAQMAKNEEGVMALPDLMPYIVVVIDELADIMQAYPRELEAAIVRLAQMSRAVGIHLMLSTQRPSVNVITGLIKANVPARVALQVASQIDSRTILDAGGAEKLLGAGDMLYLGGEMSKPARLQSPFVSEKELKDVVKFLAETYESELPTDITMTAEKDKNSIFEATLDGDQSLEDDDELYEEARQIVIEAGKASTSYIQRKLRVGYARAARLMDMLEERGVIGPGDGAKPRSVIGSDAEATATSEEVV